MSPKTQEKLFRLALLPLTAALIVATGCTSGTTSTGTQSNAATGPAFLIGTDAPPLAAVVSFTATLNSVELTDTSGNTADLITPPITVDFARFNGLQTLVDMTGVPPATYTKVTISMSDETIGYLNTTTTPPSITTEAASPATWSGSITLNKPLVVAPPGGVPVGLRMDLDLSQSITVSGGNITGAVTPTFDVSTVARTDTGAYIDELIGGVVKAPATAEPASFVIAGPHGEQFTINTTSSTAWEGDAGSAPLSTSDIVQVSGTLDPADQTLDADEVAILTDSNFYSSGLITYVTEATGKPASSFQLYVSALEPTDLDPSVISLGQLAQVNLTGSEKYYVYWMHNPFTQFIFNSSSLVAGQDVAIGGPDTGVTSSGVAVDRIHLQNWGYNGTIVAGSENAGNGTFTMQVTGFAGVLIPEKITVYLGGNCDFRYGLGAFSDLTDGSTVRVVGLLLKNPTTGQVILWARHVDGFNFTDFSTFAF